SGEQGYTDWASLAFLREISAAADLTPVLLGGDEAGAQYLLEDLGPSISLDDVLRSTDSGAAHSTLEALARAYARLHAATVGHERRFLALRAGLPSGDAQGRAAEAARWTAARSKLDEWLAALDVLTPNGLDAELDLIAGRYTEPGPWLTFTHGDPAPTNNHVYGDTVRLLDFEYGAYRHALYDLSAWNVLCPLPEPVVAAMQSAYRTELAPSLSQIRDDAHFHEEWALLCAFRALAILSWVPPKVLEQNWPWADEWTAREAVIAAISRLEAVARGVSPLECVHEAARRAKSALLLRFPEHQGALPHWPALTAG
ncbi:MAG: hypothetical protein ACO1SX_24905, partial [Actinomycetota bacterium]